MMLGYFPYLTLLCLLSAGLYALLFKKNLIKIVIGITILEAATNLFLVMLGYREGGVAPIFTLSPVDGTDPSGMVLPTVQALTLTSIVIGVATTALMLSFVIQIYRHYGTVDARKVRRLRG